MLMAESLVNYLVAGGELMEKMVERIIELVPPRPQCEVLVTMLSDEDLVQPRQRD
jgi:hypothetical protein